MRNDPSCPVENYEEASISIASMCFEQHQGTATATKLPRCRVGCFGASLCLATHTRWRIDNPCELKNALHQQPSRASWNWRLQHRSTYFSRLTIIGLILNYDVFAVLFKLFKHWTKSDLETGVSTPRVLQEKLHSVFHFAPSVLESAPASTISCAISTNPRAPTARSL